MHNTSNTEIPSYLRSNTGGVFVSTLGKSPL